MPGAAAILITGIRGASREGFSVAVLGRGIPNHFSLMMRLVSARLGLTMGMGDGVRP
jgi:hypothetical protein